MGRSHSYGHHPALVEVSRPAVVRDAMNRAEDTVELTGGEDGGGFLRVEVGLAELDSGEDPEAGEERAAAFDGLQIAGDVELVLALVDGDEVGVVGERDGGQAVLHRLPAGGLHVASRGIPPPLAWDVAVGKLGASGGVDRGGARRPI